MLHATQQNDDLVKCPRCGFPVVPHALKMKCRGAHYVDHQRVRLFQRADWDGLSINLVRQLTEEEESDEQVEIGTGT